MTGRRCVILPQKAPPSVGSPQCAGTLRAGEAPSRSVGEFVALPPSIVGKGGVSRPPHAPTPVRKGIFTCPQRGTHSSVPWRCLDEPGGSVGDLP